MSSMNGELVTETFEYDGGRQVTVYIPPNPPGAIVFAGDGGWHISRLSEVLDDLSRRMDAHLIVLLDRFEDLLQARSQGRQSRREGPGVFRSVED